MEKEAAELLVRTAALEAVREFEKSQKKNRKVKVFQNAKKLMENYNRICKSVQEGVSELIGNPPAVAGCNSPVTD